jgi:hypothetical protein
VLTGNIPRFSWQPSAAMLLDGLTGTTVGSASNRIGQRKSACNGLGRARATASRAFFSDHGGSGTDPQVLLAHSPEPDDGEP